MRNKTIIALVLVASLGISPVFAQPLSCNGCPQVGDQQSTQQANGVEWQILNVLGEILTQLIGINSHLQTQIDNQQTEIKLLKNMTQSNYAMCKNMGSIVC